MKQRRLRQLYKAIAFFRVINQGTIVSRHLENVVSLPKLLDEQACCAFDPISAEDAYDSEDIRDAFSYMKSS